MRAPPGCKHHTQACPRVCRYLSQSATGVVLGAGSGGITWPFTPSQLSARFAHLPHLSAPRTCAAHSCQARDFYLLAVWARVLAHLFRLRAAVLSLRCFFFCLFIFSAPWPCYTSFSFLSKSWSYCHKLTRFLKKKKKKMRGGYCLGVCIHSFKVM